MRLRILFFVFSVAVATAATIYGQPYVHDNSDFVVVIVTVFTVFAGFLIGVITILGDPSMIPDGSWRIAEARLDNIDRQLLRQGYFFVLYLITIGFLLAGVLVQHALDECNPIRIWIERAYLFLGVFSFILSFALPSSLIKLQKVRIEAEIERRRQRDGVVPGDGQTPQS